MTLKPVSPQRSALKYAGQRPALKVTFTRSALKVAMVSGVAASQAASLASEASADEAAASAAAALVSQSAASASASAALTSENNAETAEANAETAQGLAEAAQTAAEAAQTAAELAETNAETAASTATTQAGIATTQAGLAATSAGNAATAETNAETAETNAEIARDAALAAQAAAEAAAASLDLPTIAPGDAGKVLTVNVTEDGYELETPATGAVDSVNGATGVVVLDADDIDDAATTNKFATAPELSKLAGIETGADVTDAENVASAINGVSGKTTPVDADELGLIDSAASNVLKKLTWANLKATLKTYFDTLYNLGYIAGGTDVAVADGGTGRSSHTAYAVICGGTTSTGAQQSIASVGTSGHVLTSNGAGALPTFQAPSAGSFTAASQAQQEAATDNTVGVTPGRQHFHPSASKCWGTTNGGGTPSLAASYNVTSVSDDGPGLLGVTIATDFSSSNYSALVGLRGNNAAGAAILFNTKNVAAGTFQIAAGDLGDSTSDPSQGYDWACFGDL